MGRQGWWLSPSTFLYSAVCLCFSLCLFCFFSSSHQNRFQLACHSDRLRLPCVIRPWRFPGHFSGYAECMSVSSTLSHWQTSVFFHVFVRLFYNFTNSTKLYQANPSLVLVILQSAIWGLNFKFVIDKCTAALCSRNTSLLWINRRIPMIARKDCRIQKHTV